MIINIKFKQMKIKIISIIILMKKKIVFLKNKKIIFNIIKNIIFHLNVSLKNLLNI
jgi:hypothetical protein